PVQGADIFRGQAHAIRNLFGTLRIILAGTKPGIQKPAGDVREVYVAGIPVLQLFQAAAPAAIAQAFPFGGRHFIQGLGLPEESLLFRGLRGSFGHGVSRWLCLKKADLRLWAAPALRASSRAPGGIRQTESTVAPG